MNNTHSAPHNMSLDYCLRFGHLPPSDLITARNVLAHIVGHARQSAFEPHEVEAVDAAERNARAALSLDETHAKGAAEHATLRAVQAAHPRLQAAAAGVALFGTVARAIQPRDVTKRAGFDADLGTFNAHPADPRTEPDEDVGDMLEQLSCAERAIGAARDALDSLIGPTDKRAARRAMDEARGFLVVPR